MSVSPALIALGLTDDEQRALTHMTTRLEARYRPENRLLYGYYGAKQQVKHMGLSVPSEVAARIKAVIGWAGSVADVLEERLDWKGWSGVDDLGLQEVFDDNNLEVEAGMAHIDALVAGTSFIRIGTGGEDEPPVLVTMHSPLDTTAVWDARGRRVVAGLTLSEAGGREVATFDVPGSTLTLNRGAWSKDWKLVDRDDHGMPFVPLVRMVNRPRSSDVNGRSELTPAVRYYCDAAVRTMIGMEANREFYSIPQLMLLGRGSEAFVDSSGNPLSGWRAISGHVLAIGKDDEGDVPKVSQLQVGSPQPFLEQISGWGKLLSAEAGIPTHYLGMQTDNPASADAIRAGESRLVKRSLRRQSGFGRAWREVGAMALMVKTGAIPENYYREVSSRWVDPSTATTAAAADEIAKLVAVDVLPPRSRVTWTRAGVSDEDQKQLRKDFDAQPAIVDTDATRTAALTVRDPEESESV